MANAVLPGAPLQSLAFCSCWAEIDAPDPNRVRKAAALPLSSADYPVQTIQRGMWSSTLPGWLLPGSRISSKNR